jgi:uncharacterized protein DUF5642
MRVFASCVAIALCAACGQSGPQAPPEVAHSSRAPAGVNPERVERVRSDLPTGYEFAPLPVRAAPVTLWGFGTVWTADPPGCGGLADPAGDTAVVHGWSASGPGGIVYAVVADAQVAVDGAAVDSCGTWSMSAGPTIGVVDLVAPPQIEGAPALGMIADSTTTVEGGIETHSHAETFIAYLGDHVAYVTVVTDPGASAPSLAPGFASDLLVKTVAAIRG